MATTRRMIFPSRVASTRGTTTTATTRRASRPRANAKNRRIIDDATETRARRENDRRRGRPSRARFGRAAVVAPRAIGDARAGREDAAARDDDDDDEGAVEFELDFDAREIRARENERGVETMVFESDAEDEYERIAARMEARMEEAFEAAREAARRRVSSSSARRRRRRRLRWRSRRSWVRMR